VNQPRAADDFAMIRARMKELRRERERVEAPEPRVPPEPPPRSVTRVSPVEISTRGRRNAAG
jgi:hypothetical protein